MARQEGEPHQVACLFYSIAVCCWLPAGHCIFLRFGILGIPLRSFASIGKPFHSLA